MTQAAAGIRPGSRQSGQVGVETRRVQAQRAALGAADCARFRSRRPDRGTSSTLEASDAAWNPEGYAVEKDEYVVLSDEDLEAANPKATQTVDIIGFVPADVIERVYYAKPY